MYQSFYSLREWPFELTPNPKFLYMTPRHREALSNLQYGLSTAKAVTVLVGEAGTGKTTLLRTALDSDRVPSRAHHLLEQPRTQPARVCPDAGSPIRAES